VGQIDFAFGDIDRQNRRDLLDRHSLAQMKGGPQNFMAPDNLVQASLQDVLNQSPGKPQCRIEVVQAAARLQLIKEPQALLCVRERMHLGSLTGILQFQEPAFCG
jgi:hypothetical protein